jgi:hypothetical protein
MTSMAAARITRAWASTRGPSAGFSVFTLELGGKDTGALVLAGQRGDPPAVCNTAGTAPACTNPCCWPSSGPDGEFDYYLPDPDVQQLRNQHAHERLAAELPPDPQLGLAGMHGSSVLGWARSLPSPEISSSCRRARAEPRSAAA